MINDDRDNKMMFRFVFLFYFILYLYFLDVSQTLLNFLLRFQCPSIFFSIVAQKVKINNLISLLKLKFIMQINQSLHLQKGYNHSNDQHYLIENNNKLHCICQLCTCGNHHCPKPPIKGIFQTSYNNDFKQYENLTSPKRPQYHYQDRHYNPQVLKTNYQQQFEKQNGIYPQPSSPSRFQNVGKTIIGTKVPFLGVSSYKDQYKGYQFKKIDYENPQKQFTKDKTPELPYRSSVKFQGISSYKSTFTPPPEVRPNKSFNQNVYKKIDVPFYGQSSYKSNYQGYKIQPQQQIYQSRISNPPHVKFQGHTAYKDFFVPPKIQTVQNRVENKCPLSSMNVPNTSYLDSNGHMYYDDQKKIFV